MAWVGEAEIEYESDPEEEKRLLGRRRREAASDDEEGEGEEKPIIDRRAPIHPDESDDQVGAADYDDDDDEEEDALNGDEDGDDDEEVYDDEEEEEEVYEEEEGGKGNEKGVGGNGNVGVEVSEKEIEGRKVEETGEEKVEEGEEGKKENEPFAVPTAGAFYMHDDRFRDSAGGRHRRTLGRRKLWESKDTKKWGHDKFEEMTLQERHYEPGRRNAKGNFHARGGKNRGPEQGYARRNRLQSFSDGNNQNQAAKVVRGRGPRKGESTFKSRRETPPVQSKQPGKPLEKHSHGSSGRVLISASNTESDQVPTARKNSNLSSASPPFYPSGSSSKDITLGQKRDVHGASTSKNHRTPVIDENFPMQQTSALVRGKNIADSVAIDKLYIDDSISPAGKTLNNMQTPPSVSSVVSTIQSSQSRAQGRGVAMSSQRSYQGTPQHKQTNRTSPTTPLHSRQRSPAQNLIQPAPAQSLVQHPGIGSQASSPPKTALSLNSYEAGEAETAVESSKSRTALVGKGKGIIQGNGRGSFLYGGAEVVGATRNMSVGHGDQNLPGTPTFFPVMQFGSQHPGGVGVPAVGMAFPGYVAQPQLGLGNSEMTWLPVLTGAAGALGAPYCSPYLTVDGAYHGCPSSEESSSNVPDNEWKPAQRPELASDEFGQRQKPRRYSEMDFKQPSTST
ncbi:PREDICTED: dentin matrix acidic phosphoprotein 1-like isoform X2 [Populus euphratica]|uniref:Dentin matrix acidic phosphoprotein 1-like isoform X2 n=1 Tax=Populus euphratica TaxID=75702 RepID=A0AAJ6T1U3_POPEU|nr:PREDICTED: dentin matrix acidic phosphoprotein 1-like isoform X2 [Populus euphratica]